MSTNKQFVKFRYLYKMGKREIEGTIFASCQPKFVESMDASNVFFLLQPSAPMNRIITFVSGTQTFKITTKNSQRNVRLFPRNCSFHLDSFSTAPCVYCPE